MQNIAYIRISSIEVFIDIQVRGIGNRSRTHSTAGICALECAQGTRYLGELRLSIAKTSIL